MKSREGEIYESLQVLVTGEQSKIVRDKSQRKSVSFSLKQRKVHIVHALSWERADQDTGTFKDLVWKGDYLLIKISGRVEVRPTADSGKDERILEV